MEGQGSRRMATRGRILEDVDYVVSSTRGFQKESQKVE